MAKVERELASCIERENSVLESIVNATVTGPLSIAVKLASDIAFAFRDDHDVDGEMAETVYRYAVKKCGYDPAKDFSARLDAAASAADAAVARAA